MTNFNDMTAPELRALIAEYDEEQAETFSRAKRATMIKWLEENVDEEEDEGRMAAHIAKYREGYVRSVSYTGRKSLYNGDEVAQALEGQAPADVIRAAEKLLGMKKGELMTKYEHLNLGQIRMSAGNRIRGAVNRGEVTLDQVEKALSH